MSRPLSNLSLRISRSLMPREPSFQVEKATTASSGATYTTLYKSRYA